MAKVNLRAYNRDIESMIDRAQLDEAIAHCHHILKTFPKHLETYRLLGKAYLEYKRHKEAADIFTRILTSEPNDFVANVGMSLIRDEESKFDDAIWHMERAFEVQSANPAIQGELQRLYARRDGMAPPRIRMTRGALAHMYMRGELYPQAISEARSVLKEDTGRNDMQVLLALAFYRSGQKNEAAEMAASVLRRYQYCLDANRVMVEILGMDRPESVQPYRQAVVELDPYASQVNGTVFQSTEVGDNAITLDRLEWNGQPVAQAIDWNSRTAVADGGFGQSASSLPAATPTPSNEQPDWLKAAGFGESQVKPPTPSQPAPAASPQTFSAPLQTPAPAEPTPAQAVPTDDNIPDFLRAAGWGQSTGTFDESKSAFDDEPAASPASDTLQQGDLPDWVKDMMPSNAAQAPSPVASNEAQPANEEELPDWIKNIGAGSVAAVATSQNADQADWLEDGAETSSPTIAEDQSGWMSGLPESSVESPATDNSLDWLTGTDQSNASKAQPEQTSQPDWMTEPGESESTAQTPASDDTLNWLSGLDQAETSNEQPVQSTQPDWMKGFDEAEPAAQTPASDDSLDWLSGLDQSETTAEQPVQSSQPDWMKGFDQPEISAEQSAEDSQPDWMQFGDEFEGTPAPMQTENADFLNEPAQSEPEPTPVTDQSAGTSQQDIDDSLAWLENLAAKQGATEGLLVKPEDRKDKEPDWVAQAKSAPAEPSAPKPEPVPEPTTPTPAATQSTSQQDIDDSLAWLENLAAKQGATEGLLVKPEDRKDKEPDWVAKAKSAPVEPSAPTPDPEPTPATNQSASTSQQDIDDSLAWLENLAAKQGATEGLLVKPEDRKDKEPDWVSQAKSAPAEPPVPTPKPEPALEPTPTPAATQVTNTSQQDIDDSLAWLENLAAKQGATEGLLVKPEDRKDKEPDWVAKAKSAPPEPPAPMSAPTPEPTPTPVANQSAGTSQQDIDDSLAWLENLAAKQGATEGLLVKPEDRKDKEPDWVAQAKSVPAEQPTLTPQQEPESFEQPVSESAGDMPAWLRDMENNKNEAAPAIAEDPTAMWLKTLDEPETVEPQQTESVDDLPAWLQGIESENETAPAAESNVPEVETTGESDWMDAIEEQPESAPVSMDENIPSWLKGMEEESSKVTSGSQGDLPAWLQDETGEVVAEPTKIEPTHPSDWTPAVEQQPVAQAPEPPKPQPVQEEPKPVHQPKVEAKPEPKPGPKPVKKVPAQTEIKPATPPAPYKEPVTMRGTGMLSMPVDPILGSARSELSRSNIPGALEIYGKMIKKGRFLDETIFDLREALDRFPVEVSIWQTLGDAYMRANRLQDALDAYTKAEELLR